MDRWPSPRESCSHHGPQARRGRWRSVGPQPGCAVGHAPPPEGGCGVSGSLGTAFRERFEAELPEQLNQAHRSLIVAESVDASTDRIVRYLAEMEVPINVATVQYFEDANGRELLAQVYLIEPEAVQLRARRTSARSGYRTVNGLQDLAD